MLHQQSVLWVHVTVSERWMSHAGSSHLVPRLHEAIPPSELLPHKLLQNDDSWMPSDRPRICSAVNYSASSIFTSLREVWKPLASPLSAAPAVSHHQSLVSRRAYFLTDYSEPGDKVFPTWSQRSAAGRRPLPFNWCPWEPASLSTKIFDWSLGPTTTCPLISHLFKHDHRPTKQLQLSPRRHSPAFTAQKLNDSEHCFQLFIWLLFKVTEFSLFCLFISSLPWFAL